MLFSIGKKTLYTEDGKLIKVLHCPMRMRGSDLLPNAGAAQHFYCEHCEKTVHDTRALTESEVVKLVEEDPEAYLAIHEGQNNVTLQD